MARGRTFRIYQPGDPAQDIHLTAANGYRVLDGVKGLGMPMFGEGPSGAGGPDGYQLRGPGRKSRQITLPLEVAAGTRQEFIQRCQALSTVVQGQPRLQINDAGIDVTVDVVYLSGLQGAEGDGQSGESGDTMRSMRLPPAAGEVWQKATLVLDCPRVELPLTNILLSHVTAADFPTANVRNLITNPSFEVGLDGWTAYSSGTIDRTTLFTQFGSRSLQAMFDNTASGTSQLYGAYTTVSGLTVGVPHTASAFIREPDGLNQVSIYITDHYGDRNMSYGDFERITNVFTPTATSHTMWVLNTVNAHSTDAFQLDGVMVNVGSTAAAYVDGTQPGCVWDGAPHASTSRFVGLPASITTVDNSMMAPGDLVWMVTGPATSITFMSRASGDSSTLTYPLQPGQRVLIDTQGPTARLLTPQDGSFADIVARSTGSRASGGTVVGQLDTFWKLPAVADPEVVVSLAGYSTNTRVDLATIQNLVAMA